LLEPLEQRAAVVAAEPHRVRQRVLEVVDAPRAFGDVVEVAQRVGLAEVDRRRHDAVAQRERADGGLQRTRGAEQVAGHALRR
jgi:hypothetical protein